MEALIAFALIAAPGVLTSELVQLGRPPLARLDRGRDLALYLLLSAGVWAVGVVLFSADEPLANLIRLESDDAGLVAGIVGELVLDLLLAVTIVGLGLRLVLLATNALALRLHAALTSRDSRWARDLASALAVGISPSAAWDRLLAQARRGGRAQVVHVRLRDGRDLYGLFAGRGRADWDRDGRGLLLDSELVERDGNLIDVGGSRGLFVAADAVASVSFIDFDPKFGREDK